jgi:hypothetical protein
MRLGERLELAGALLIGAFGVVMIAGVLIQLLEGTSKYSPVTDFLLGLLLGALPLIFGLLLYRRVRRAVAGRRRDEREAAVLKVAKERQGTVTAVDVAAACGMGLEHAQETLDGLQRQGFCEMDVADSGAVVYRFRL